ncbi:hypothetical protein NA56DRAFT_700767 [Hyaloscypha hepaticicola]|uniref:Uncharacterized protein n=1 Tax=Hyaloscypha hepaticicola TaxID=2082293 RepID=A0A2J6QDE3_9HELO|nr:hypothetical protein NA56DRAFT_700767 [Hyaloscypha hepaticicola]
MNNCTRAPPMFRWCMGTIIYPWDQVVHSTEKRGVAWDPYTLAMSNGIYHMSNIGDAQMAPWHTITQFLEDRDNDLTASGSLSEIFHQGTLPTLLPLLIQFASCTGNGARTWTALAASTQKRLDFSSPRTLQVAFCIEQPPSIPSYRISRWPVNEADKFTFNINHTVTSYLSQAICKSIPRDSSVESAPRPLPVGSAIRRHT